MYVVASMAWKLHAIEQAQYWEHRRVDGVEAPRHRADAVTGTTRLKIDCHAAADEMDGAKV